MAIAATLVARLKADTSDFNKKMKKSTKSVKSFRESAKGAAIGLTKFASVVTGVAVAAVVQLIRKQGALIDSMAKLSSQTKVNIEDIAGLRLAADITGSSAANMDKSIQKLSKNIGDAARGTGEAKDAISDLGISIFSLALQSPSEQLRTIADAFSNLTSQSKKASIAQALFGRGGIELIPLLEGGSSLMNSFTEEAKQFGTAIGKKAASKVENLNDSLRRISELFSGLKTQILVEFAPKITKVLESFRKSIQDEGGALNFLANKWKIFSDARNKAIRLFEIVITKVKIDILKVASTINRSIADLLSNIASVASAISKLLTGGESAASRGARSIADRVQALADKQAAELKANQAVLEDLRRRPPKAKKPALPKKQGKDIIGPAVDSLISGIGEGILSGLEKVVEGKKVLDSVVGKAVKFVQNFKAPKTKAATTKAVKRETVSLAAPSAIEAGSFAAIKAGRKEDRRFKTTLEVMKDQLGKLSNIDKKLGNSPSLVGFG